MTSTRWQLVPDRSSRSPGAFLPPATYELYKGNTSNAKDIGAHRGRTLHRQRDSGVAGNLLVRHRVGRGRDGDGVGGACRLAGARSMADPPRGAATVVRHPSSHLAR